MRVIAGPCLLESVDHGWKMANELAEITAKLSVPYFIFKASVRKENRTSARSPRGEVDLTAAARLFDKIEKQLGFPCVTDVSDLDQAVWFADYGMVCQIPALLSRQTRLIEEAACAQAVHIKKGQFMHPMAMRHVVDKVKHVNPQCYVMVSDRGTCFGYNDLIIDPRSFRTMKLTSGADEVLVDATHAVQEPSWPTGVSGGRREFIEVLARAGVAAGADGVFAEVHDDPANALSDGPCQIPLKHFEEFLKPLLELHAWATENPFRDLEP